MDNAENFCFTGLEIGYSHQIDSIDVSDRDYWTTLSGYNKESDEDVTHDQIRMSETLAARLFYNLKVIKTSLVIDTNGDPLMINDLDLSMPDTLIDGFSTPDIDTPIKRIGLFGIRAGKQIAGISAPFLFSSRRPVRFYNGDIEDESNFVGFGLNSNIFFSNVGATAGISIRLLSMGDDFFLSGLAQEIDIDYTEIDGFHFVCVVGSGSNSAFAQRSRDPIERLVESTITVENDGNEEMFTSSASIDAFEFFEYE